MVVHCTWDVSDSKELPDAVLWSTGEDDQSDVEDEVDAENCVLLMAPSAGSSEYLTIPACQLLLSCEQGQQMSHLSVLSEARVLEVYGHHGEYLKTVRCQLLEEVDDMAVFKGSVKFDRPVNLCSIKFACLRSKSEMWLYGVKAKLLKASTSPERTNKIPMDEVVGRLKDMGLTISENAECLKRLIDCYQQGLIKFTPEDIGAFLQQFRPLNKNAVDNQAGTATSSSFATTNNIACSSNADMMRSTNLKMSLPMEPNNNPPITFQCASTQTEEEITPNTLETLKYHIDQKLNEIDEKLWDKVQKRLGEIEAKLMCKLDEVESFVKPQGIK